MSNLSDKLKDLPVSPGVYIFKNSEGDVLYVGKATSLRDRVSSYFQGKNGYVRPIEVQIAEVAGIEIKNTETVLEAYILEQELIKKFQPPYNVDGKDNKSFSYVVVTKEKFPRFLILRKTELETPNRRVKKMLGVSCPLYKKIYGPYISKKNIEITLKILRKIFPYHAKPQRSEKGCLDSQIGLCPGPYDGGISEDDYRKNIKSVRLILEGKKPRLMARLKKDMEEFAKKNEYEKAADARNKIFSLQHLQDVALISNRDDEIYAAQKTPMKIFRIEGYDISNISGRYSVGSMVVFDNSEGRLEPNKSQYRKFKIRTTDGPNDVGAMEEVLMRRFRNNWPRPDLMILDGGAGHLNAARKILRLYRLDIPLLAVAKGPTRKKLDFRPFGSVPQIDPDIIEQIRDEAHRFAILYHRTLRRNSMAD